MPGEGNEIQFDREKGLIHLPSCESGRLMPQNILTKNAIEVISTLFTNLDERLTTLLSD